MSQHHLTKSLLVLKILILGRSFMLHLVILQLISWLTGSDLISLLDGRLNYHYFSFHPLPVRDAVNHQFYNLGNIEHLQFLVFSFAPKPSSAHNLV